MLKRHSADTSEAVLSKHRKVTSTAVNIFEDSPPKKEVDKKKKEAEEKKKKKEAGTRRRNMRVGRPGVVAWNTAKPAFPQTLH